MTFFRVIRLSSIHQFYFSAVALVSAFRVHVHVHSLSAAHNFARRLHSSFAHQYGTRQLEPTTDQNINDEKRETNEIIIFIAVDSFIKEE